jgi:hypothetical protein
METWDVQELRNIEDFKFSTTIQLAFVPCTHIFVGRAKMTAQLGQMSSLYIYRQEVKCQAYIFIGKRLVLPHTKGSTRLTHTTRGPLIQSAQKKFKWTSTHIPMLFALR